MEKVKFSIVYNRKGVLLKDGTAPISICVNLDGKRKYISTEIRLKPDQWDKKKSRIKPSTPNYQQIKKYLNDIIEKLEKCEMETAAKGFQLTFEKLSDSINPKSENTDFILFVENYIKNDRTRDFHTLQTYITLLHHLQEFKKSIRFEDLNTSFIMDFENFLSGQGLKINTVGKNLKILRALIRTAIDLEFIESSKYVFRNYKIKSEPTHRTYLTPEEIDKILNINDLTKAQEKIRDMYLFGIYTGLRFSDLTKIGKSNIQEIEGKTYLVVEAMEKTKQYLRLPIYLLFNGKAIELIEKYDDPKKRYFFDDFTSQYINRELKKIAAKAGIDKVITFHTSRHTAATYLLYKNVPMAVIQKILGHTKISTTQIYAKVMDITLENEIKRAFEN